MIDYPLFGFQSLLNSAVAQCRFNLKVKGLMEGHLMVALFFVGNHTLVNILGECILYNIYQIMYWVNCFCYTTAPMFQYILRQILQVLFTISYLHCSYRQYPTVPTEIFTSVGYLTRGCNDWTQLSYAKQMWCQELCWTKYIFMTAHTW